MDLTSLALKKHIIADNGENGSGSRSSGADGKDIILEVPLGTVARYEEIGEKIFEITEDGEERIMLPGGKVV